MELDPTNLQRMIARGEAAPAAETDKSALERRIAALEDQVEQQDAVLKHMLRMLIEYFEDDAEAR